MFTTTIVLFFLCIALLIVLSILVIVSKRRTITNILLRRNSKIVLLFIEEGKSINDPTYMKTISLDKKEKEILDEVYNFMVSIGVAKNN
jgi:hypothetical protein